MGAPRLTDTVALTEQQKARGRKRAQRAHPLTTCESCGTTALLSRHHRDRNPLNNDSANVAILCLACHTTLEWQEGTYATRPKPRIVRGARGRIVGTLPSPSPRTSAAKSETSATP